MSPSWKSVRWISILLHAGILIIHVALTAMLAHHPEHALVVELDHQAFASTITAILLQVIGTVRSTYGLCEAITTRSSLNNSIDIDLDNLYGLNIANASCSSRPDLSKDIDSRT